MQKKPLHLGLFFTFVLLSLSPGKTGAMPSDTITPIQGLVLEDLGKQYTPNPALVPAYLSASNSNLGGNTSVRRNDAATLKWKDEGYYQRNRELGQTFNVPAGETLHIDAIVLRTGNGDKAILPGTIGEEVYIQFFEVEGDPVINDNGTPQGTESTHGFNKNHRTDDYLEGVTYKTLAIIQGGIFPDIPPTTQDGGEPGHLRYIRWDLQGEAELTLEGGKSYAFMVGFTSAGPEKGFTLGNDNWAASGAAPALRTDANGLPWWSLRREGDGTLPPTQFPGLNPPADDSIRQLLIGESLFQEGHECELPPTTDGFPDVDTYRTHEFYIELVNSCPEAGTPCDDGDPSTENDAEDGNCNCYGVVPDGCTANGLITYKRFDGIGPSREISSLKGHPDFPGNPSLQMELELFEAPSNVGDGYGASISGFLCPPVTGEYVFWIAGDANFELNLSFDKDPANKRRIAFSDQLTGQRDWDAYTSQQSAPILLRAGEYYYIEALLKESSGDDHLAVGWEWPDGTRQRPMPGEFLSSELICPAAGTPCDDGNPNTVNDVEDGNCNCGGENTCPPAGTPCDDGQSFTENDTEDGNCNCGGDVVTARGLRLTHLGKSYQRDPLRTPDYLFFDNSNMGGSTSVRRVDAPTLQWKDEGYFQRNRDLGQTFYVPADTSITLDAIVLRTGNSSSAVKVGALGAEVFIQFFKVEGTPVINDNGTPQGTKATHGFTDNHRADDYLEGITYKSLRIVSGGFFPVVGPTTQNGGQPGHLEYIRWDLTGDNELTLEGGKRYAFMVGFMEPAPDRRFTLGNVNRAANPAAPNLAADANGNDWWSMRREGDGTLPPTQYPGAIPPADPGIFNQLIRESLFENAHQYTLSPATDGWPDVDTYRTLEFYIELREPTVDVEKIVRAEGAMNIYPNPAARSFRIDFYHRGRTGEGRLLIRDVQGRVVWNQIIALTPGQNAVPVTLPASTGAGWYQVNLVKQDEVLVGRVVLNR